MINLFPWLLESRVTRDVIPPRLLESEEMVGRFSYIVMRKSLSLLSEKRSAAQLARLVMESSQMLELSNSKYTWEDNHDVYCARLDVWNQAQLIHPIYLNRFLNLEADNAQLICQRFSLIIVRGPHLLIYLLNWRWVSGLWYSAELGSLTPVSV